jgi:hypothetical protein
MIKYNDLYTSNSHGNSNGNSNGNDNGNSNSNSNSTKKNNSNNTNTNYRPIETYKETLNTIYDLDNLDIFQNKVEHLF